MSVHSDSPKKNPIVPVHESGKDYPEGEQKPNPIKFYKVFCPQCRAQPGQPCFIDHKRRTVSYYIVCIARTVVYDAFELGSVDVNGIGRNGQKIISKE